jgi:two-component system phosphate regulon sensor histidine kinase PhoR
LNLRPSWAQEFWRILVLLAVAWIIGQAFNQVTVALLLALLAYTLRNLYNLHRLANWLGDVETTDIPIHFGLWGDIYSRIARVTRRQAQREKRLSTLLNEYASSTSALPDAAVALDESGRIRWFNEAASRLLGLLTAKDIGQPLLNLFRSPDVVAFLQRDEPGSTLQTAAPGNPARQLEIRVTPYGDGQKLLLAQDITERLQHERMRKDFVANVSHELRTPLTVISGFIENLQANVDLDASAVKRPLVVMEQQATRMRRIVEDLLLLARLESEASSRQDTVTVDDMLLQIAGECAALRDDSPAIRCEIDSKCRLRGDEKQLHSAVTNLLVNAVNHTPPDGNVVLSWSDREGSGFLSVRDDGEGIAEEHLPRLTERFYRVDAGRSRERGGTGLGLAIVKHILNRHDARLEIHSRLGEGSEFVCVFPASRLICL